MRKIAVLLLLLMMATLFCACTNPDESASGSPGESSSIDDGWTPPVK